MSIITAVPESLGAGHVVADSTALAAYSPDTLTIGTKVFNQGVGGYFTLTVSTASLVTDSVVAVAGTNGARWILDATTPTTAITQLTSDGTAGPGPGSVAFTLAASLKGPNPKAGTNLTDADQTIQPVSDGASVYTQSTTLTADRTKTIGVTGAVALALAVVVTIVRRDAGAHALVVKDSGGATLSTFASGAAARADSFYFDTVSGLYKYLSSTYAA